MRPPLWLQWVLSIVVAAAVIVALVRFVQSNTANQVTTENASGEARANEEAETLVAEDQAPHTVRLPTHTAVLAAVNRVIRAEMITMINDGTLDGPLQHLGCSSTGRPGKARQRFSCTVSAAGVNYPFVGVVDARDRTIVFCKRDPPPVPSQNVPLSPRCTA
jgi:TPP-dependent trihydroxycyclohexane-1,2-dione (THcHDO) dehydratase